MRTPSGKPIYDDGYGQLFVTGHTTIFIPICMFCHAEINSSAIKKGHFWFCDDECLTQYYNAQEVLHTVRGQRHA